jgi:excisionase family DNA binding protein
VNGQIGGCHGGDGSDAVRIGRYLTPNRDAVVPPRIASWLEKNAGLSRDKRISIRDTDPLAYEVLAALHIAALCHRSGAGTELAMRPRTSPNLQTWLTTADVAKRLGVTDRAIRKWIAAGRLPATKHGGRWLLDSNHVQIAEALARLTRSKQ